MRKLVLSATFVAVLGVVGALALQPREQSAQAGPNSVLNRVQKRLLSGIVSERLQPSDRGAPTLQSKQQQQAPPGTTETGCPANRGSNVRVNQNCLNLTDPDLQGRAQAENETSIAQDPNRPSRMVSGANDYRRGDGNCFAYTSSNAGRGWQDAIPPTNFTRGDAFGGAERQYWQASGDTSVAWDTKGNAYFSCQVFNRGTVASHDPDQSSAFYVFRSTGTGGRSWNFPGRPVAEANDTEGTGATLLDKQYMTIDNHVGSPFQDRIYVTWTLFAADGTAYIFGAFSKDYGETFSTPRLVSGDSPLCSNDLGLPTPQGRCNANQDSQPFTGPDGALYVAWANFNVTSPGGIRPDAATQAEDNRGQMLLARSTDGGETFSAPVKVSDYYELPDCLTYQGQDAGRACVPEKGDTQNSFFRATNYPSGGVNPKNPKEVIVSFGSYINRHSNESNGCVPQGFNPDTFQSLYDGVKTPGACNNDIVISRSTDGGRSFTGTKTNVRRLPTTRAAAGERADQYFQWAAFGSGGKFAVSYYDRAYGDDETTGFSDVTLSGSTDGTTFASKRVTTSSMPPPTQFDGTFFGDYSGLSVGGAHAHPMWMDTRDPDLFVCRDPTGAVSLPPSVCTARAPNADIANDQNVYTRSMGIPTP